MANSLSHITNRVFAGETSLTQGTTSAASSSEPTSTNTDTNTDPPKRKRGRPRGSSRKAEQPQGEPKIKRPVGRPRKDGLPAGSVPKRSPTKRQKLESGEGFPHWASGSTLSGVGYPVAPPPMTVAPITYTSLESKCLLDDWGQLVCNNSQEFLAALLTALATPNPSSATGPTVEEAFKMHLQSLTPTSSPSQTHNTPTLYSVLKTFWLPSSPAYFSMAASTSNTRVPMEYKFLYWDPQPLLFNGIQCPYCPNYLINEGRIRSGPIKIYDLDMPFFVIGCEYACTSEQCVTATTPEGRKFSSVDSSIMSALPKGLRDEFPARLLFPDTDAGSGPNIWNWNALGVSTALWNLVMGSLSLGLRRQAILQLIRSVQYGAPPVKFETKEEDRRLTIPADTSASVNSEGGFQSPEDNDAVPGLTENAADSSGDAPQTGTVQNNWNVNVSEAPQVGSGPHSSPTFAGQAQGSDVVPGSTSAAGDISNPEMNSYPQPRQSSVYPIFGYSQYPYYPDQRPINSSPEGTGDKAVLS
ncbi:hypothetical protein AX15_006688 [Amanita polypyramis BW_CC]|nr:hypothetical protein AX15_006688 [Amanita polypyramis BW_CC]